MTGTSYQASLSSGGSYRWNVDAINSAGASSFSTPLYFLTPASIPAVPVPTSPGTTSQSSEPTLSSSTATLSWNAVSGATSYEVAVRDLNTNQLVVDQTVTGTSYQASLASGGSYRWDVDAINSAGASNFSTPLYFLTPASISIPSVPVPTSPGTTSQSSEPTLSSSTATLSWNAVSGATSYEVAVRDLNTNQLVVDQTVTGTSYQASLASGGSYRWDVDAINSAGASSFSSPLYFLTPAAAQPGHLTINLSPDQSVIDQFGSSYRSSAFWTAVTQAANFFENSFFDPITVNVTVGWGKTNGGAVDASSAASTRSYSHYNFSTIVQALRTDATSTADQTAVSHLPMQDPGAGGNDFAISNAEAKALGLTLDVGSPSADGWIGFGTGLDPTSRGFVGMAEHELSEVLGRVGETDDGTGAFTVLDLFRYFGGPPQIAEPASATGPNGIGTTYFSIDGGLDPINSFSFSTTAGKDLGVDWAGTNNDAFDAEVNTTQILSVSVGDLLEMDVLGYNTSSSTSVQTPSLSSVSPNSYPADSSNHAMQLLGSNFQNGDTLTFIPPEGGSIASRSAKLTFISSTEIDYQFNDASDAGSWSVRVNSADGTQHSSYVSFTVPGQSTATTSGIDYRRNTGKQTALDGVNVAAIASDGYKFVGEYLGTATDNGYLTSADAAVLSSEGLAIVSLYERTPTSVSYFTTANADFDASHAIQAAQQSGQTAGTGIYFTIDYDPTVSSDFTAIDAYFREIRSDFTAAGSPYKLGIYGPGDVLSTLAADTNIRPDYTWLDSYAWPANGFTGQNIRRVQNDVAASPASLGFNVDLDTAYGTDFGQWSVSPAPNKAASDFNGDGKSDIFWRDPTSGTDVAWTMNGNAVSGMQTLYNVPAGFSVAGMGDFTGNGTTDILWRNPTTGADQVWLMSGGNITASAPINSLPSAWTVADIADFNGDGADDILLRNSSNGANFIWTMNGDQISGGNEIYNVPSSWTIAGVGKFFGGTQTDILLRQASTGTNFIWKMGGTSIVGGSLLNNADSSWSVAGLGDFNGDGTTDVLMRQASSGTNLIWTIQNGAVAGSTVLPNAPSGWTVAAVADFNHDGTDDILIRNATTGTNLLWTMQNGQVGQSTMLNNLPSNWSVAEVGDFNGDRTPDVLWHDSSGGANLVWTMSSSGTITSSLAVNTVPTSFAAVNNGHLTG
ncbi:MAG TPA: NF038122 family metalloprotease [Xanthobacteraceae bacterium]|nr:NF038122 family metalloprotease [Xanthobacteraceae bacterium]